MTRPGRGSRAKALANQFAEDPLEAVLHILRRAPGPLTAAAIKDQLLAGGVAKTAVVESRWRPVREQLARHDNVTVDKGRYAWTPQARTLTPVEALELIARRGVSGARRVELLQLVRAALAGGATRGRDGARGGLRDDPVVAARQRQADIDAVRMLAELASEVEELVVNEASPNAMIHRVRSRVKRSGLEPVDRAGEETRFDRKRHKPISGSIRDGATVVVVRPGYLWKAPNEDLLVVRPVVEE